MDKIETQLEDIAGIRLICQFTEDIYTVAGLIRERSDMQVKSEKDYITHRKKADTAVIISLYYIRWKPFAGRKKSRSRFRFVHWV